MSETKNSTMQMPSKLGGGNTRNNMQMGGSIVPPLNLASQLGGLSKLHPGFNKGLTQNNPMAASNYASGGQ